MILAKVIQTIRLKRFPSGMSVARRLLLRSHAPESPLRSARIIAVFFQTAKKKKKTATSRPALWSSEKTDSAVTPLLLHVPLTWRRTEIFINFFFFFLVVFLLPSTRRYSLLHKTPYHTAQRLPSGGGYLYVHLSKKKEKRKSGKHSNPLQGGGVDLKCIRSHQGLYKE